MLGRKAMSPLIATLLLIAFAVALGAMIMNWSSSLVAGGAKETKCKALSLEQRIPICYSEGKLVVNVQNNGEEEINSLVLRISTPDSEQDIKLKNSYVAPGKAFSAKVTAARPENFKLSVLANVRVGEDEELCDQPLLTFESVKDC